MMGTFTYINDMMLGGSRWIWPSSAGWFSSAGAMTTIPKTPSSCSRNWVCMPSSMTKWMCWPARRSRWVVAIYSWRFRLANLYVFLLLFQQSVFLLQAKDSQKEMLKLQALEMGHVWHTSASGSEEQQAWSNDRWDVSIKIYSTYIYIFYARSQTSTHKHNFI